MPTEHPGQVLADRFLGPLGVSASELARAIDVPRSRISEILSGHRGISVDTARRLGMFFDVDPRVFTELQLAWDLAQLPPVEIEPVDTEGFLVGPHGATPIPRPQRREASRSLKAEPGLLERLRAKAEATPERPPRELVQTTYANGQKAIESKAP